MKPPIAPLKLIPPRPAPANDPNAVAMPLIFHPAGDGRVPAPSVPSSPSPAQKLADRRRPGTDKRETIKRQKVHDRKARQEAEAAKAARRRLVERGVWKPWERNDDLRPPRVGWAKNIEAGYTNDWYVVLITTMADAGVHLAVRAKHLGREPPWADMQRIKNELVGEERLAVQIYPRDSRRMTSEGMYHLWVLPPGWDMPIGLHPEGC